MFDWSVFPQQNHPDQTHHTLILNGTDLDAEALKERVTQTLSRPSIINMTPNVMTVDYAQHAILQYYVGYVVKMKNIVELLTSSHPNVTRVGNRYGGISVNECIAKIKAIADLHSDIPRLKNKEKHTIII